MHISKEPTSSEFVKLLLKLYLFMSCFHLPLYHPYIYNVLIGHVCSMVHLIQQFQEIFRNTSVEQAKLVSDVIGKHKIMFSWQRDL